MVPETWIEKLFARMSAIYGSRMSAMWADVPHAEVLSAWRHGLSNVDGARIASALERLPQAHPQWPPTLGEFLTLTKVAAAHRELPRLPPPEAMAPQVKNKVIEFLSAKKDPRRWAHDILREEAAGTYRGTAYGVQLAKEALGMVEP